MILFVVRYLTLHISRILIGVLNVRLFVLFFEGKANLKNTGAITLPSLDDIERAPADLKERLTECLQATTSIDLGHEDYPNLHGMVGRPLRIDTPTYTHIHI